MLIIFDFKLKLLTVNNHDILTIIGGVTMAINKETHVIVPVVMSIEMEKQLKELAKQSERSRSAQVITYIKEGLKKEIERGDI
jgi:hypothetical protein